MGIFFTAPQRPLPTIRSAFQDALMVDPKSLGNPVQEAADRTLRLEQAVASQFQWGRFAGAVVISVALLIGAIRTHGTMPDISTVLLTLRRSAELFWGCWGEKLKKAPEYRWLERTSEFDFKLLEVIRYAILDCAALFPISDGGSVVRTNADGGCAGRRSYH
jgi:hypothetical protein